MAEDSTLAGGLLRVGRHFQLVSVLPAAAVVLVTYGLIAAGVPAQAPSAPDLADRISNLGAVDLAALATAVLIVATALDPFQFVLTQLLEGYWGPSRLARAAMFSRARIHLDRQLRHLKDRERAKQEAERLSAARPTTGAAIRAKEYALLETALDYQAFDAAVSGYPPERYRVMPTRLGNVLRRHEDLTGVPYGIEHAIAVVPHLLVLNPGRPGVAAVEDARSELDLAIRWVVSWLLVASISFVLLVVHGPWVAISLLAYGLAWCAYRGSVHAAIEYGRAIWLVFDLNMVEAENRPGPLHGPTAKNWISAVARHET